MLVLIVYNVYVIFIGKVFVLKKSDEWYIDEFFYLLIKFWKVVIRFSDLCSERIFFLNIVLFVKKVN